MLGKYTAQIKKLVVTDGNLIENFRTNRRSHHLDELLNEIELEFDLESLEVLDNGVLTLTRVENCDGEIASYKEYSDAINGLFDAHYDIIVIDCHGDRVSYDQLKKLRHEA